MSLGVRLSPTRCLAAGMTVSRRLASLALLLAAVPATLAQCVADTTAGTTTCSYTTQGADSTFVVPASVTSLDIVIAGADGGADSGDQAGGFGASISLPGFPVKSSDTLLLCVRCARSVLTLEASSAPMDRARRAAHAPR